MSIASYIFDIKSKFVKSDKTTNILENYEPDLEAGEGGFYRRLKARQIALETNNRHNNTEISIDVSVYDQPKLIESFVTITDIANYFSIGLEKKKYSKRYVLPFVVSDINEFIKTEQPRNRESPDHLVIEINEDIDEDIDEDIFMY